MKAETWGVLAHPPATLMYLRRRRLIKTYRRHREDIEITNFLNVLARVREDQARRRRPFDCWPGEVVPVKLVG